jgi:O-antigen/teichoic acid export membrane protein
MYTIAGSLPMASAIILLPFYLLYLTTDNYGALSLYFAFSVLIQVLTTYSFDTGMYVFFHEYKKNEQRLGRFVSSVFIFLLLIGVGITVFFLITGNLLFNLFLDQDNVDFFPFGLMAVITGVFQSIFKVHSSLLQTSQRPVLFFWSNLLSFAIIAIGTIIGLKYYPQTLWGPIGGRMVAATVSAVWVLGRIAVVYGVAFEMQLLRNTFGFNTPSFLYQLQQWSMTYFDRFIMVFFHLPLSIIGVYDFAVKCMLAIEFVISGLYNSFYPRVIGMVMEQDKKQSTPEINRYYHGLVAAIMLLVCLAILAFSVAVDFGIIRSGYEKSVQYLPLIGMVYLVRAMRYYFTLPYGALKFSKPLPVIYMGVSVFKILLILIFIRQFDVYAVIGAALVSSLVEAYLLWRGVRGKFHFQFNGFKIILAPLILAAVIAVLQQFFFFGSLINYSIYLIICLVILILLYRREVLSLLDRKTTRG